MKHLKNTIILTLVVIIILQGYFKYDFRPYCGERLAESEDKE